MDLHAISILKQYDGFNKKKKDTQEVNKNKFCKEKKLRFIKK